MWWVIKKLKLTEWSGKFADMVFNMMYKISITNLKFNHRVNLRVESV